MKKTNNKLPLKSPMPLYQLKKTGTKFLETTYTNTQTDPTYTTYTITTTTHNW